MVYFVELCNKTCDEDNEMIKIWANSLKQAKEFAKDNGDFNFYIGQVFTNKQFKKYDSWYYGIISKWTPANISEGQWRKMFPKRKKIK